MVFVCNVVGLRQATPGGVVVEKSRVEGGDKSRARSQGRVGLALRAVVVSNSLGVVEDRRLEEHIVGLLGFGEGLWALRMELEGRLVELECIVDLESLVLEVGARKQKTHEVEGTAAHT